MSEGLRIAAGLELPLSALTRRIVVLGQSDTGKTNTVTDLAEEVLERELQVVVVDYKGDFWGVQSSSDGKRAGYPIVIFGGDHADVELHEDAGAIVADLIVDNGFSAILDLSKFESKASVRRFVTAFAKRPVRRNATAEELQQLSRGIGRLQRGEAFVYSPSWLRILEKVTMRRRRTFDSSRTPEVGDEVLVPTRRAQPDIPALQTLITEARQKQAENDPALLRAQLAERDRRIRELEARPAVAAEPEQVEVPVLGDDQLAALRDAVGRVDDAIATAKGEILEAVGRAGRTLEDAAAAFGTAFGPIAEALRAISPSPPAVAPARMRGEIGKRLEQERSDRRRPGHPAAPHVALALDRDRRGDERRGHAPGADELGSGPKKILEALAGTRDGRATRTQLGFLSGYAAGGGSFGRYMSTLRSAGLVAGDGSTVVITDIGRKLVGSVPAVTTADVHAMWRSKLKAGSLKMFEVLISRWPEGVTREQLGELTGYETAGGSFGRYLSTLGGLDIIERRGSTIVASEALFPTGRPR